MGRIERIIRALADLLFPRACVVCGRELNVHERGLCIHCRADLPETGFFCSVYNPVADRFNELIQRDLHPSDAGRYAYAGSLLHYRGGYRNIPRSLKYRGDLAVGRAFGRRLGLAVKASPWGSGIDAVVPVPLHWRRRFSRGYNQAGILAREVAEILGCKVYPGALRRRRFTRSQTRLSGAGRLANVGGAFAGGPQAGRLSGAGHILLVDDVLTTGATLLGCYTVLRELFPEARISVCTLSAAGM